MSNGNLHIEDIPIVPEDVLDAASRGKLVVFVGAGVSRIIGCPSWKEFSIRYLKHLYNHGNITYHEYEKLQVLDPRKLLSICKQLIIEIKSQQPDYQSLLSGKQELIEKYKIYEYLYSFNTIYVTTNYDKYLDKEAEKVSVNIPTPLSPEGEVNKPISSPNSKNIFYYDQDILINNLLPGNILHLHGSTKDPYSIIMTTPDYLNHYIPGGRAATLLDDLFNYYNVLFIGYGLEEYELLEYLVSRARPTKNEIYHYILFPAFQAEANLIKFHKLYYKSMGIKIIPYPIDTKGYEHLVTVIADWARQIGPISNPPNFYDRVRLIDEVVQ